MGNKNGCMNSAESTAEHSRATSLSDHEPELGQGINKGDKDTDLEFKEDKPIKPQSPQRAHQNHSKHIKKFMKNDFKANAKIKKCLLLGSGSSGKSTLFRQLKVIHGAGFGADEFIESKQRIRSNCVLGVLVLLKKSQELYQQNKELNSDCYVDIGDDDDRKYIIDEVQNVLKYSAESFEEEEKIIDELVNLGASIKCLWELKEIQCTYAKRQSFSIIENLDYFLNKVDTIFDPNYQVTHEDHLKCRIRTTGMILADYVINKVRFNIYDVGGQRNERKKWYNFIKFLFFFTMFCV